ncbi:MAG: DUF2085 domain-containing protein [Thermoflexales bacterium]|nr:DUF2085 domain-containing protein [Thermoflexales bacterium]
MAPSPPSDTPPPPRWQRNLDRSLLAAGLLVLVALWLAAPGDVLDKADRVGYAVCHRIPVRSYFFADRQLPLCARCSGQYLGTLFGLAMLLALRRERAGLLPPAPMVGVLLGFLLVWAVDGFNSYLTLFPSAPHLYEPRNVLRVATGGLQGVALITLALPFFNITLWARPTEERTLGRWRELAGLALIVVAIVLLVKSGRPILLYPLALLSVAGTLALLTLVNTMLLVLVLRRENQAEGWRQAAPLLVAGLALGGLEVLALNLVRAWLTDLLGLPF